jgi:membrane protease YdiL (CAAX protease family)
MPEPFSLRMALAWTVLVTFGLWLGISAAFLAFPHAAQSIVLLGFVQVAVYALILVVFASAQSSRLVDVLALRKASLGVCLTSLALGVFLQVPATLLSDAVEHFYPTAQAELIERVQRITPHSKLEGAAIFAVVVLLGPCVEEFFFRGALFGALRRSHTVVTTAVMVAACFALGHMDLRLFLPLFVTALAIGDVRERTGSIWPGMALHAAFNATTLLAVFQGDTPDGKSPQMPFLMAFIGCTGTALLLALARRLALSSRVAQNPRSSDRS